MAVFGILLGLCSFGVCASDSADLAQAERMVRSGRGGEAYALLSPHAFARAGDPDFDYLFGLSALEAGHPGIATLAFERVLALEPQHGAARLDIGRAYFALGDMQRARQEFLLAQALNPPPAARAMLARYLGEMETRQATPAIRGKAYVEVGFGTDSNLTQGPNSSSLFLPVFGLNFQLNAANQKLRDDFSQTNAGGEITHQLDATHSVYAGVDARWRNYQQSTDYNYASTDWRAGVQWVEGRDTWRLGAGYNDYRLDHQQYRSISSLGGEWRRAIDDRQQWMLFGQYAQVRYGQDAQANNDVNQWLIGGGWLSRVEFFVPTLLSFSTYAGIETEADSVRTRVDGDKNFLGFRAGGQISPHADVDVFATAGLQFGEYRRTNILYGIQRSDRLYEAAAGSVWRFARTWSLKPQVTWLHNNSNLAINDYQRYEISIFLRHDFQ